MERYSRQLKLGIFDDEFQNKIKHKKILVVGCGGVGSILSELLVRGGFVNLKLMDCDVVDLSNLQRQGYFEDDIGKNKALVLSEKLVKIDSTCKLDVFLDVLDSENIEEIAKDCDLIVDCTDNFVTRILINEFCEGNGCDWLYNGAIKTEFVSCLFYGEDKLYSKVFRDDVAEESCSSVGVLASTTFSCASLGYNLVLKYFLDIKDHKMIKMDLWNNKIHEIKIK